MSRNIDSSVDFDGVPLRNYSFFVGRISAEAASMRIVSPGQMLVRSVSDSNISLIVRTHQTALELPIAVDASQRLWFVNTGNNVPTCGGTLAALLSTVHRSVFGSMPTARPSVQAPAHSPATAASTSSKPPPGYYESVGAPAAGQQQSLLRRSSSQNHQQQQLQQLPVARSNSPQQLAGGGFSKLQSDSMKKALEWDLAQLPCFYTSSDEENNLKPANYLLRTSTTNGDSLVVAYRDSITLEVVRVLIRRLDNSLWQSGTDRPFGGAFADFIRKVLPKDSIPHNDPSRVQHQQRQMSMRSASRNESVEQRAQSQLRGGSRPAGNNALLKSVVAPTSTMFNGVKSNVYGSVGAALQFAKENDEDVFEGTVWTGLARTEALAALNPKHDDLNGVSLASEPWYFFDLDTFGANAILSGLAAGSFLVRLNSSMTQFAVSFMRETAMQPVHILLEIDTANRTVTAVNVKKTFSTVRELVTKIGALRIPLSRMDYAREFVDCAIELREKPLGLGAGGVVLRGKLNSQVDVAVKRLLAGGTEENLAGDSGRVSEAEAMLRIRPHPNVNRLYGLVLKPMSLVIEFCDRGSLDQMLGIDGAPQPANGVFSNYSQAMVLKTNEVFQLARDIARGVAHLHDMRIVHRDLATRNILISSPLVPKVCDFGMSRLLGEDEDVGQTAERKGPIKWQAPEQLRGVTRTYSFKSDVFSFAVLLTEIVNNQLPWPDFTNQAAAIEVVKGFRTKISKQCAPSLRNLIEKCWNQDPELRPTMAEVAAMLENPTTLQYDAAPALPNGYYDDVGDV